MNTKIKRIAFISEHASPLANIGTVDTGGQNVYVAQLARHLAARGYLIDIYTRRDDAVAPEIVDWESKIRVIHVKAGPAANIPKEEMLQYMDEFKSNMVNFLVTNHLHYELIHANFFMSALVASGIKKELDIPFVVTFHALGSIRKKYQGGKDTFPPERIHIEETIVKEANHIIAECPQDKDDLVKYYHANKDKISIVPCGFSSSEFYPIEKETARKILRLPTNCYILLQLGRMVRRKGIDNVIRALAHLKSLTDKPLKLVIVGGDAEKMKDSCSIEYRRLYRLAKKLNVQDDITFEGRRDRDQLKFYYNAADLFITTPWYEPFGITPLEAMACGTPVIGAKVGGIKFSVKDGITGAHVPARQPKKLALTIAEVISNKKRLNDMGQNAIAHVNTHFTWAKVAEQMVMLYNYVLSGSGNNLINLQGDNRAA